MKLKTINEVGKCSHCPREIKCSDMYLLRQEAIAWIKAFQEGKCWTDFAADGRNGQENIIEWIEHFFSISGEDLE